MRQLKEQIVNDKDNTMANENTLDQCKKVEVKIAL